MTLHEPTTFATDLLLAGVSGVLALRLLRGASPTNRAARWWCGALALSALAALLGGTYHAFGPEFPATRYLWWRLTLIAICGMAAAMDFALLYELSGGKDPGPRKPPVLAKAVGCIAAAIYWGDFSVAVFSYGLSLLAWVGAAIVIPRPWRFWILTGVGGSAVAAAIQQLKLSPAPGFNHNDLYHAVQVIAVVCLYQAGTRFGGAAAGPEPMR